MSEPFEPGSVEVHREKGLLRLALEGPWTVQAAGPLFIRLESLAASPHCDLVLDGSGITELDTTGAWLLHRTARRFEEAGHDARCVGLSRARQELLDFVRAHAAEPAAEGPRAHWWLGLLERLGRWAAATAESGLRGLSFAGRTAAAGAGCLGRRTRFPFTSLASQMDEVSLPAIPVVALIGFLIGIVIAYQGALQLARFGAELFVVDLVSISVLREIGILLTAIVVAGRSGSAFTAEIGAMSLNEEVDAMRTIGLDPMVRLVVPRVLALVVMLPALTLLGNLTALVGGGVASVSFLGLSPEAYLSRLQASANLGHYLVGLSKAPVFGAVIAMCGCHQGLAVRGSANDLGERTTRAVVQSIFLVIVLDAFFSVLFAKLGV